MMILMQMYLCISWIVFANVCELEVCVFVLKVCTFTLPNSPSTITHTSGDGITNHADRSNLEDEKIKLLEAEKAHIQKELDELHELSLTVPLASGSSSAMPGSRLEPEEYAFTGIGTASTYGFSEGNTLPLLGRPWGFNHWAPQTQDQMGSRFFHMNDRVFHGIRCTHQPSPWIADYAHFLISPQTSELKIGTNDQRYSGNDVCCLSFRFVRTCK